MLDDFWSELEQAKQALLLLDYDGTLAPFQVNRNKATPYPGVRDLLDAIRQKTETRLVMISGRAIKDLIPLLGLDPPPEIWGCHGWEKLDLSLSQPVIELPDRARSGLKSAQARAKETGFLDFCEIKPASLAVHWRGFSEKERTALREETIAAWQPIATDYDLEIHPFNGGLELRCPGKNKATAINAILADHARDRVNAFLGDDLTDEDGFKAIKGKGLGVLVNPEQRQTHADIQITPPEELLNFLSSWLEKAPAKKTTDPKGAP